MPGGRFVLAVESHEVLVDQPDLAVGAIRQVVEAARDPGTWITPTPNRRPLGQAHAR